MHIPSCFREIDGGGEDHHRLEQLPRFMEGANMWQNRTEIVMLKDLIVFVVFVQLTRITLAFRILIQNGFFRGGGFAAIAHVG